MPKTARRQDTLKIVGVPLSALKPHPGNARQHSLKQIRRIADSIQRFGFTNPILVDDGLNVLAGHGRLAAAKLLEMADVPTIRLRQMTLAEKRAYIIADNRLTDLSTFDRKILASEYALILEADPDFDLELTGFDLGTIELVLDQRHIAEAAHDEPPACPTGPAVSQAGDLWRLGRHRLLCGDALDRDGYTRLLGRRRAQMAFADVPYNVKVNGNICRKGKHREFAMASGEMTEAEFVRFLTSAFAQMARVSVDGSLHYVCIDWRHVGELLQAGRSIYDDILGMCVWAKTNAGMGSFYRSQHELVFVLKHGQRPHINNIELGKHGRNRSNVWTYPGANSFSANREEDLAAHPTVKPLALVADAILDASRRDGIILDPFAGSGTTLLAAEQTGREAAIIEIDPLYCDTIIRRFQAATGDKAVSAEGETFDARAARVVSPDAVLSPLEAHHVG